MTRAILIACLLLASCGGGDPHPHPTQPVPVTHQLGANR